jgi:hypothetical protein
MKEMKFYSYGQILYDYFKKGFMFGVEYELATLIPYSTLWNEKIVVKERAQILLLKAFNIIV